MCDEVLLHKASTPQIIANSYLHILNSKPEFLERYDSSVATKVWLLFRYKLISIARVFQAIFDRDQFISGQNCIKPDVLFVSHLTNKQQLNNNDCDVYFGNIPSQLLDKNINSSIVLINHTKVSKAEVLNANTDGKIPRILLDSSLDVSSEIKLFFEQLRSKRKLKFILKELHVDTVIAKDVLRHQLSSDTFNALRIARKIADIVKKNSIKSVVLTYEGHAWERLVFYYVRMVNPDIKCFGYQHAAICEYQHAIKRSLHQKYNPDAILTSGLVAKEIFSQRQKNEGTMICIGSTKSLILDLVIGQRQCCLVVPEGSVSECLVLFEFSLSYARRYSRQKFIWRLHPLLSFKRLKKRSAMFKKLPSNIRLSEGSLDGDIQKCDSVLYRGSTSVINAINAGLKPIYYRQATSELSIDPIYKYKEGKEIVQSEEELGYALYKHMDIKTKQSLRKFAQNFYTPLNLQALIKAIF